MAEKIVKVQVPLFGVGEALIYLKGRKSMRQQELDASTKAALGSDPKGYFKAELADDGWRIGERVKNQDW